MFNRTIYLMLSSATLSASSLPTNSGVKIHMTVGYATHQYRRETSKVANYMGLGTIVITKESLIRFGFAVYYYA